MFEGIFIAFIAKLALAGLAVVAMRLTLALFDRITDFEFKDWIEKMYKDSPDKLALYYGLRYIGVAIIFAWILG